MVIIYEVESGKPHTVEHMIDAREAVANGFYAFTAPVKEEKVAPKKVASKKVTPPKKIEKVVVPEVKKEVTPLKKPIRK